MDNAANGGHSEQQTLRCYPRPVRFDGHYEPSTFCLPRSYTVEERGIARGSFGEVAKASLASPSPSTGAPTATTVAVKKFVGLDDDDACRWLCTFREIAMLRFFRHPCVISAMDVIVPLTTPPGNGDDAADLTPDDVRRAQTSFTEVYVVLPFFENTLAMVLRGSDDAETDESVALEGVVNPLLGLTGDSSTKLSANPTWCGLRALASRDVRLYIAERILSGLAYLHQCGIVHRDLKPENILIDSDWRVCLCDFGQAKGLVGASTASIVEETRQATCTQYYAPPELLPVGATVLTTMLKVESLHAVDMWSVGCLMAEMIIGKPLFDSGSPGGLKQLDCIVNVLGVPSAEDAAALGAACPYDFAAATSKLRSKGVASSRLEAVLRATAGATLVGAGGRAVDGASEQEIAVITRMLQYDPAKRITAAEAIAALDVTKDASSDVVVEAGSFAALRRDDCADPTSARALLWRLFTDVHPCLAEK